LLKTQIKHEKADKKASSHGAMALTAAVFFGFFG
jgi:hypothetical protein